MDVHALSSFLCVADLRSFTRASERLNVTQPALSRQIKQLEQEVGVALFERHGRGVSLTSAGVLLRERAQSIVSEVKRAKFDVANMGDKCIGEIRIGFLPSARLMLTMPVIERLKKELPDIFVTVTEASSSEMIEQIGAGVLDVAVIASADRTAAPTGLPLLEMNMVLAGHRELMKNAGPVITADFIASVPLIATPHHDAQRELIYSYLAAHQYSANVAYHASSLELAIEMMKRKLGCYVIPACVSRYMSAASPDIVVRSIPDLFVKWTVIHAKDSGPKQVISRVQSLLRKIAATVKTDEFSL